MVGSSSVGYNFNNFNEIKSHSSILYNERMAILFYLLDMWSIEMNTAYDLQYILKVRALVKQIYKNIRMLIWTNPAARAVLNLETKHDGLYTTDLQLGTIDKMIEYCEQKGFTMKQLSIIINELNDFELVLKEVLQYFHYFIRPEFRQKPDLEIATERYKEIADRSTIEDLKSVIGKRHKIDFENLGTRRVELTHNEIEYDSVVDDIGEDEAKMAQDIDNMKVDSFKDRTDVDKEKEAVDGFRSV
jgi:hypothetical protein